MKRIIHQLEINPFALKNNARQQRLITNRIDEPRDALAVMVNSPKGRVGETRSAVAAAQVNPVLDVLIHLATAQGEQVIANVDSLPQLAQLGVVEAAAAFSLTPE